MWEGAARRRRAVGGYGYRQEAAVMTRGLMSYPEVPGLPLLRRRVSNSDTLQAPLADTDSDVTSLVAEAGIFVRWMGGRGFLEGHRGDLEHSVH